MARAAPYLIFISAEDCFSCKALKATWPSIRKRIDELKLVNLVSVSLSHKGDAIPVNLPQGLNRFNTWWPTFIVVSSVGYSTNDFRGAIVFNSKTNASGGLEPLSGREGGLTFDKLPEWLSEAVKRLPSDKPVPSVVASHSAGTPLPVSVSPATAVGLPKDFPGMSVCSLYSGRQGFS